MATFKRTNAWNDGGTFDNPDLLWYAKAVGAMQSRDLDDPTSWWFFAAIHGEYLVNKPPGYPNWADIPGRPQVPTAPLPANNVMQQYWNQCQHGSWFFPPWHRGYLYALENVLRAIVIGQGGPDDWALPYWNYFGVGNQYEIPPAFTQHDLPDGSPNPLFVDARYGPNNDRNIFIPLSAWGITQRCQQDTVYTGEQPNYYGGDKTGFAHGGEVPGDLEWNPHNFVHGAIGGQDATGVGGLMGFSITAALDPVFYLHHCNIDRMWAAWNASGNSNPADASWHNGPTATGDRKFYMPNPDGSAWQFTPAMVNDIVQLDYTYDDLSLGVVPPSASVEKRIVRMRNFTVAVERAFNAESMERKSRSELVGANAAPIVLNATGAHTTLRLDTKGWGAVSKSIKRAFAADFGRLASAQSPDEVYLQLEGIKGKEDSIVCAVSVNHHYAGHISLFGLRNATAEDGHHGGSGLTVRLDISKIVDELQLSNAMGENALDVLVQPVNTISEGNELTIDRISVYRKGQ